MICFRPQVSDVHVELVLILLVAFWNKNKLPCSKNFPQPLFWHRCQTQEVTETKWPKFEYRSWSRCFFIPQTFLRLAEVNYWGQDPGSQIFHLAKGPSQLLKSKYDQSPGKALDKLLVSIVVQWQMSWFCHHQALIYKFFFQRHGKSPTIEKSP